MSAYIQFYLRSNKGEYLPIGTFSRNCNMYLAAEEICDYGKFTWITRSNLHEMIDTCETYIIECKKRIEKYNETIEFLKSRAGDLDEIMGEREEYIECRADCEEEIKDWKRTKEIIMVYLDILDEAYDTKFGDNGDKLDENYYLLCGHECEFPRDEIVPDFPGKIECDPDGVFDAEGFRRDFAKFINETAGEEVLDVKPHAYSQWDPDATITTKDMDPEDVKKWDRAYEDAGFTFTKGESK